MNQKERTINNGKSVVEHRFYELPDDVPAILLTGDKWYISDKKSNRLHFHNCDEIGYCHSGEGIVEFDDQTTVKLKRGDFVFIPRYLPHTTYSVEGTKSLWSYIFVDFNALVIDSPIGISSNQTMIFDNEFISCYAINKKQFADVHGLCKLLLAEITEQGSDWKTVFKSSAMSLFVLIRRMSNTLETANARRDSLIDRSYEIKSAIRYIHEHYADKFTISTLAGLCHLSENHFRRLFHAEMGVSPLSYLNFVRIRQACIMLTTSNRTVINIAETSGFNSIASFNRNFKKISGISPRDYRRKVLAKPDTILNNILIQTYNGWTEAETNPL